MASSVYSGLAQRLAQYQGETYPFHIGDTWMDPPQGCHMEDLRTAAYEGLHRYAPVQGLPELRSAIVERVSKRSGEAVDDAQVLITAGATGGLGAVLGALLEPGDEVLILAPYWPLIEGIVRSFHGTPIAVPAMGEHQTADDIVGMLQSALTEQTVAVYWNTPNNPTGVVLSASCLRALSDWARANDLWILADEVYEDYAYGAEHVASRPFAPERTFASFSFSKAFGMSGNRVGYVVGPAEAMQHVRKVSTHTYYSVPTASQVAAIRVLQGPGDRWAAAARDRYVEVGRAAAERLGVAPPGGSTFLFLNVAPSLDTRGLTGLLEDLVQQGLLVAPGPSFGPFPTHVRCCYTATEPVRTLRGIEILAKRLGR
jgi:N-succinyldiaminopimelate aminotransferase